MRQKEKCNALKMPNIDINKYSNVEINIVKEPINLLLLLLYFAIIIYLTKI